jgi:hypothetical protein
MSCSALQTRADPVNAWRTRAGLNPALGRVEHAADAPPFEDSDGLPEPHRSRVVAARKVDRALLGDPVSRTTVDRYRES